MIYFLSILSAIFLLLSVIYFIKYINLGSRISEREKEITEIKSENQMFSDERIDFVKEIERLKTSLKIQEESKEQTLKNSKAILYDLSSNVANQLIEVHKKEVNDARKQSEEKISQTTESFNNELKKVASLVGALNKDVTESKTIVDNLRNSLLSPSSTGALAEITLENLLKNSGLKKGVDFELQYSFESNNSSQLRPDAVIFLPDDNIIIIDAKSSKFLIDSENDDVLSKSMNLHLRNLLSKDYLGQIGEFFSNKKIKFKRAASVMFVPTEQALERIAEIDKNFMNKAFENNVFPAGPTGLMNILSIARMRIGEKSRIDNYEQIIHEINNIINSIGVLSEHASKVGSSISSAASNYDKFAGSFNRNIASKIKNLKTLGTGQQSKNTKMLERFQIVKDNNEIIDANENEEDPIKNAQLKNID